MSHRFDIEWIYHFTCSSCKNWWSYASGEVGLPLYMQQNLTCPHCGLKDSVVRKVK